MPPGCRRAGWWPTASTAGSITYGRVHHLRRWLEAQGQAHVVGVLPGQVVAHEGQSHRATVLVARLPPDAWVQRSAGSGSQGERVHEWACVPLSEEAPQGMGRWLLVRRTLRDGDPTDLAYFRAYGPAGTPPEDLVRIAGRRWAIETSFENDPRRHAAGTVGVIVTS